MPTESRSWKAIFHSSRVPTAVLTLSLIVATVAMFVAPFLGADEDNVVLGVLVWLVPAFVVGLLVGSRAALVVPPAVYLLHILLYVGGLDSEVFSDGLAPLALGIVMVGELVAASAGIAVGLLLRKAKGRAAR